MRFLEDTVRDILKNQEVESAVRTERAAHDEKISAIRDQMVMSHNKLLITGNGVKPVPPRVEALEQKMATIYRLGGAVLFLLISILVKEILALIQIGA